MNKYQEALDTIAEYRSKVKFGEEISSELDAIVAQAIATLYGLVNWSNAKEPTELTHEDIEKLNLAMPTEERKAKQKRMVALMRSIRKE